eukprot:sb/3477220/
MLRVKYISQLYEGQFNASVTTVAGTDSVVINVHVIARVNPAVKFENTTGGLYYTVNGEKDFVFNVNVTGMLLLPLLPSRIRCYHGNHLYCYHGYHHVYVVIMVTSSLFPW